MECSDEVLEDEVCEICGGKGYVTQGQFDEYTTKKCPECSVEDWSGADEDYGRDR